LGFLSLLFQINLKGMLKNTKEQMLHEKEKGQPVLAALYYI
jgi:hypothetical protein